MNLRLTAEENFEDLLTTKKCTKCHTEKRGIDFYYSSTTKDKRENTCKECKKDMAKNRVKQIRNTQGGNDILRIKDNQLYHKNKLTHSDKYRARAAVQGLPKLNKNNQWHHFSYNPEHYKEVIELTREDHMLLHTFMTYDKDLKMFRTKSGEVLDTMQKHIELLNIIKGVMEKA